jgi:small-conductance mechanosensitive channel
MFVYAATNATQVTSETASKLAQLFELMITRIPLWIAAFILFIASIIVAKIARKIVENKLAEKGIEEEHKEIQILGGRMTYAILLTLGITISLKVAGIDLTTIIAAGAFGIGFALKDMIMNFLAGIMILVGRHFTIGDFINVGGTIGKVMEIQSRVTILQAIDGTKVIVPNADLFRKQVISFTSNPFRKIEVEVGADYRSNLENVVEVCMKAVKRTKGILVEPKPAVIVSEWGDSEVVIKVKAWVESKSGWLKIKSALMINLMKAYNEYNIDIPWPMSQIVYDKDCEHGKEKLVESEKPLRLKVKTGNQPPVNVPTQTVAATSPAMAAVPVIEDEEKPLKPLSEQR